MLKNEENDEELPIKSHIIAFAFGMSVLMLLLIASYILSSCSMTFQNVTAGGAANDLSDETTTPQTKLTAQLHE